MNSGMLPLRRCTFFWIVDFVYSMYMYNMQKKKKIQIMTYDMTS